MKGIQKLNCWAMDLNTGDLVHFNGKYAVSLKSDGTANVVVQVTDAITDKPFSQIMHVRFIAEPE